MKANLKTLKRPAVLLAGLMAIGIGFSGCSPFRAAKVDVDTVRIQQLRLQEAKKKAAAEKKRQADEAARIAAQSSSQQPAGEQQQELNQTTPAVEPSENGNPLDGLDGSAQVDPSTLSLEARDEAAARRAEEEAEKTAVASVQLEALTDADTAFVAEARELFSAKIIGENSVTPDEMVDALNLDPSLGQAIFAMTVNKAVETSTDDGTPSVFNVNVEMALRSIILEQVRASQFSAGYYLQNGTPIQVSPTYVALSGAAEAVSPENIVIHSACVTEDCAKVVVYVEISGVDNSAAKQMAAFLFEDQENETKMKLVAASVGANNVKDMADEAVQAELLATETVSLDQVAEEAAEAMDSTESTEQTEDSPENEAAAQTASDTTL